MKKLIFLFSLLIAAVCVSAQPGGSGSGDPIIITGVVTETGSGAPVANREVYTFTSDSINPAFGYGITNENGAYEISMLAAPATAVIQAMIIDFCTGNGNGPTIIEQTVPVSNGIATANFEVAVCSNGPCVVSGYATPTLNTLETQFYGYAYDQSGDSLTVYTYSWDFGDGQTGTGDSPLHTYSQAGTYTVVVTASSANCTATYTFEVTVELLNLVNVSGTVTDPNGNPVPYWQVQVGDYPFEQYVWTDESGAYTTLINAPLADTTINVYTFDFCDSLWNGTQGLVVAPIVNNAAIANFVLCDVIPPTDPCSVYFTYYSTAPLTYQFEYYAYAQDNSSVSEVSWDFGDGATSNEPSPVHTYALPGVYTVLLTTMTENGCEAHACDIVFAFDDSTHCPIDTFYYGCQAMFWATMSSDSVAIGLDPLTLEFTDVSFGVVASRLWDFGDGTTSTDGPTVAHTYATAGLYNVTLNITTLDGCESTIMMQVYVGEFPWVEHGCQALFLPIPDSTGNGFLFLDLSVTATPIQSWSWDFGDGTTSNESSPYHIYSTPGIYTVSLTIEADSCSSVISFEIDTNNPFNRFEGGGIQGVAAGVSSTQAPETISSARIAPNPATDHINIAFDSKINQDISVNLLNTNGQAVRQLSTNAFAGWNALKIPANGLSKGLYFVQIQGSRSSQVLKVVVE